MPAAVYDGGMGQRRLLIVDDEESVRSALRSALEADGYSIAEAADGATALTLLQSEPCEVVISDQMMPGISGIDFLKLVRVRHPQAVRIMLTGDPNPETTLRSINESEVYGFIRKPSSTRDLLTVVHVAFEAARLRAESGQRSD